jgi:hypothetical protein
MPRSCRESRDLPGAEAERVAEHEHGALARRQAVEAGDEGEPDRFAFS